jgi:hypothetical protein
VQLRAQLRRTQVYPADDSKDVLIVFGELQEPTGFFQSLSNLDDNAALKSVIFQQRLEFGGQKIAPDQGHCFIDPVVLTLVITPKVLMSVNMHRELIL